MNYFKYLLISLLILISSHNLNSATVIKFATLAPEGTTWTKILRKFTNEVETKTNGEVKFKIYTGGVQGDEKDIIRKIKIGQIHASGFTGYGLGEISEKLRVLDAPFLFKNPSEIDYVYQKMDKIFREIFEENGYILLGWSEIGQVYVISKHKIENLSDFKKTKLWVWEGDIIAQKTFENFGATPIPLSIADVMTSIQTNMIDTVYATPATILPLGWHTKMNYIIDLPITNASGAIVMSKRKFKQLSQDNQKIILESAKKYFSDLNRIAREDNKKALSVLKKKLKVVKIKNIKEFEEKAVQTQNELAEKVYGKDILNQIKEVLEEFRKKNAEKNTHKN